MYVPLLLNSVFSVEQVSAASATDTIKLAPSAITIDARAPNFGAARMASLSLVRLAMSISSSLEQERRVCRVLHEGQLDSGICFRYSGLVCRIPRNKVHQTEGEGLLRRRMLIFAVHPQLEDAVTELQIRINSTGPRKDTLDR